MTSQVLPIPFATGIDQSMSQVVGEPRIIRMHNARLIAPGRVAVSPGYYQPGTLGDYIAAVQCDEKLVILTSVNALIAAYSYTQGEGIISSNSDESIKWAQPAFEAPIRINFPQATAAFAGPISATNAHRWMLLTLRTITSGEVASLYLMHDTSLVQQVTLSTSYSTQRYRLAGDYTAGVSNLVMHDSSAHSFSIYSVTSGSTPLAGSTVTNAALTSTLRDVAVGKQGAKTIIAALFSDGTVKVFRNDPPWSYVGSISTGGTTISIAATGTELLCLRSNGEAQTYSLATLSAISSATAIATPVNVVALSKRVSSVYYVSIDVANAVTNDVDSHLYSIAVGTPSGSLTVTEVVHETLSASPAGAPFTDSADQPYQVTISNAAISRSFQVARTYTDVPLRTRRVLSAAHGEMPLIASTSRQGSLVGKYAAATPQRITIADPLTGEDRSAYVFASTYVSGGTLTDSGSPTAAMALVVCDDVTNLGDATHAATVFDGLSVSRTAYGRVLSCGAPFAVGVRAVAAGAVIDLPMPFITQTESISGGKFTAGQVFQYILQWEYRAPNGTLFRGPPSQPVTYTVVAPTSPNTDVTGITITIGFTPESPDMPGLRMRVYRTENGGSAYYDTAAITSVSGIGVYTLTDTTLDTVLISNQALTDGPAVSGGIKARYGFPPCRCSWRGRDRTIVGGLENPRRVRWSLLDFPGEATAFPHASELGWSADIPDDVTAVAQLDDAWIIFSRTRIWSIYGSGPDDNGLSGGFDPPRCISPNLGCLTWKSIAETESGLLFQGADGQIYLLTRGQNTIQWFSARIRDELTTGMLGTVLRNPIVATIPHDAAQTIHFIRTPLPSGGSPIIVYDRRTDAWTTDGDLAVEGLNGAIAGASILDVYAADQQTVCIVTPSFLTLENQTGTPMAPIGASWTALIQTNDIAPFGFGGWGHVYKIGVIADTDVSPVSLTVSEWLSRWQGNPTSATLTFTNDVLPFISDFPFTQWTPPQDKCSAVRLQISWTETNCAVAGVVLSVEASQGTQRLQTSRKA